MSGQAVTIVTSGGLAVTHVDSGAPPLTVKSAGGVAVTVVGSGGLPFVLEGYAPAGASGQMDFSQSSNSGLLALLLKDE